jgi:hypothetical protein
MQMLNEKLRGVANDVSAAQSDFYISFNPDTSAGMFGDSDGGPETALVFKDQPVSGRERVCTTFFTHTAQHLANKAISGRGER